MEFVDWLPALTSTGLLAGVLWLTRQLIATRLTKTVQHEFDRKLELLKAELRESEEQLKASLREKETEIAALRSGALSALAGRHVAIDKRRLEAADQIWTAYIALIPARKIAATMAVVNFGNAAREAEIDPKVRELFESIGQDFDVKSIDLSGALKARPFVSPMVWAVYSAIQAITMNGAMRLYVLKGGLGTNDFTDHTAIKNLIIAALPHLTEWVEKSGTSIYHDMLGALDVKLIEELQLMLSGVEGDTSNLQQSAAILSQANALQIALKGNQR